MKREIVSTKDGSKTIHLPELNESYHSLHGALQEAKHVFIRWGWKELKTDHYQILEIGFGSGLNTILTLIESEKDKVKVDYTGLEAFPISTEEVLALDYNNVEEIKPYSHLFDALHEAKWNEQTEITSRFMLTKIHQELKDFVPQTASFNLIYFDAFGPRVQPEMWTIDVFEKMHAALNENGILVTYCAKGEVRRTLLKLGFDVSKVPGPPGKREMLFAKKT